MVIVFLLVLLHIYGLVILVNLFFTLIYYIHFTFTHFILLDIITARILFYFLFLF